VIEEEDDFDIVMQDDNMNRKKYENVVLNPFASS
jgi:hypothetical protein